MRFRERETEDRETRHHGEGAGTPGGGPLVDARDEAERLLAAGDDAIERALSGDSQAWLDANRQRGGE